MQTRSWTALALLTLLSGCAKSATTAAPKIVVSETASPIAADATADIGDGPGDARLPSGNGTWVGAAAESEMILAGSGETFVGVWVDTPAAAPAVHAPMDIALVVDTSGSMAGAKIESARAAARMVVSNMKDGDIIALDSFNSRVNVVVPPTVLDGASRERVLQAISQLGTGGSTNMFAGISQGESQMASAPGTHSIRRLVVISDGIANVGPSTPDALGSLAESGLRFRAQVTSLGVGNDYDERTLNALAMRTSGRLFHVGDPKEMVAIVQKEMDLLGATIASDAFVEVVPAPGVQILGADGVGATFSAGGLRIPLGALHRSQHREALVRVRVDGATLESMSSSGGPKALASVRLHFRDPADADLERVQEVVARASATTDPAVASRFENARTKAIAAIQDSAKLQMQAAQRVNQGQFMDADKELAAAQTRLESAARTAKDDAQKKRLSAAASNVAVQRRTTGAVAAAPAAVARDQALKLNEGGMKAAGF